VPPFAVLHVCMGNICRSPMAERLLALAVRQRLATAGWGIDPAEVLLSHGAGTGGWHAGQAMNAPAARQLQARGADPSGFAARKLRTDQIDASDLILTATIEQAEYVRGLRSDAADRTFVLGECGRLLAQLDGASLPRAAPSPAAIHARGVALVAALDALRTGQPPIETDELDDPYGLDDRYFGQIADQIEATVRPLARWLLDSTA